jgi:hypothetical protein
LLKNVKFEQIAARDTSSLLPITSDFIRKDLPEANIANGKSIALFREKIQRFILDLCCLGNPAK